MKLVNILKTILTETVYGVGLGGGGVYSSKGDPSTKAKTISILKSGAWKNSEAGKFAIKQSKELADYWNSKDPESWPAWFKRDYAFDEEGKLKEINFLSIPALIVAVLDQMTNRVSAEWVGIKGKRNQCFQNAINWALEIGGNPVGGIVLPKEQVGKYYVDRIIVHAFTEKAGQYYEVTFPEKGITDNVIYWPLITFNKDTTSESKVSSTTWSYALGIEEGIKEYFKIRI